MRELPLLHSLLQIFINLKAGTGKGFKMLHIAENGCIYSVLTTDVDVFDFDLVL
jgi:hypothetical protein